KPTSSKSLCLPDTRRHFWVSAIRLLFGTALPKKYSLNCAIPELLNINVGSFFKTIGADGTIKWSLLLKKSKKLLRISLDCIVLTKFDTTDKNTIFYLKKKEQTICLFLFRIAYSNSSTSATFRIFWSANDLLNIGLRLYVPRRLKFLFPT